MFSLVALFLSATVLFYVVRYRIHIHIEYSPRKTKTARPVKVAPRPAVLNAEFLNKLNLESTQRMSDLVSALKHQGCTPAVCKRAAERALFHQDPDLESALRRAIDYAREAA